MGINLTPVKVVEVNGSACFLNRFRNQQVSRIKDFCHIAALNLNISRPAFGYVFYEQSLRYFRLHPDKVTYHYLKIHSVAKVVHETNSVIFVDVITAFDVRQPVQFFNGISLKEFLPYKAGVGKAGFPGQPHHEPFGCFLIHDAFHFSHNTLSSYKSHI